MPKGATRVYVAVLVLAAVAVSGASVPHLSNDVVATVCFALLFFVAAQLKSFLDVKGDVTAALSSLLGIAVVPVLGPWGAISSLLWISVVRRGLPWIQRLYNVSQCVICTFVAGLVYVALGGPVGSIDADSFPGVLLPVTAANLAWHITNLVLLTGVIWLDTGVSPYQSARRMFTDAFLTSFAHSYLGFLLAVLWLGMLGPLSVVLMLPPLLVAHWSLAQYAAEQRSHRATMSALAQAIETKDLYTRGHGERVSELAGKLGGQLGWQGDRLTALEQAGLLHDVGKIGVPTRVLQKDGKLTDDEFGAIKRHPLHGVEIVGNIEFLEDAREGIMHHHEKYDGSGYPSGLQGTDIPLFGRILGISDAFDCITTVRSYRPARSVEEAIAELKRCKGGHFDPELVDLFVAAIDRDGWTPVQQAPPQVIPAAGTPTAYDHDDLLPPPADSDSDTDEATTGGGS